MTVERLLSMGSYFVVLALKVVTIRIYAVQKVTCR